MHNNTITTIVAVVFFLFLPTVVNSCAIAGKVKRVSLKKNSTIRKTIDLKGDTLFLQPNSSIHFISGVICNGTVVGKNTSIISNEKTIFKNVVLAGSWNNDVVYSQWLDFRTDSLYDNRNNFGNLSALCTGERMTHVYMQEGVFWTSVTNYGYGLRIPSNTYFHSKATIRELPNNYKYAGLVSIKQQENVTIDGGRYIGDLKKHLGDDGEWSHGIECRASSNVTIKNVECREFWGDGIDVIDAYDENTVPIYNCKNIVIEDSKCYYNRRVGIGIEAVINCKVIRCDCRYSGVIRGTLPMSGIGIEAWNTVNEKIKNIEVIECTMTDNKDCDLIVYANGPWRENFTYYDNNIFVKDCKIGIFFVSYTNGLTLEGCEIQKSRGYEHEYVKGLNYIDCTLKGKMLNKRVTNLPPKKGKR